MHANKQLHSQKEKGTKAVTGAVPLQKIILGTNMYILGNVEVPM